MSVDCDENAERLVLSFTQLQDLVGRLQKENRLLKSRLKSYHTIGTFYHEAQQEVGNLSRQLALKDGLVKELQARLAAHEGGAVSLGQEPSVSFGPSGSLVDCLLQEVGKVKKELADSAKSWQQENDKLKEDLQMIQLRLREKEREVEQIVGSPQHEKDGEIVRLRQALQDKDRLNATQELWCRSLAGETEQLQLRLASTADMCQQLSRQLEEQRANNGHGVEKQLSAMKQNIKPHQTDSPETNTYKLQEENQTLKQKVIYVEDLNAKWQKYDVSREEYVKNLHQQLKDLKSRVDRLSRLGPSQANENVLRQEILRLNRLLEEKMKDCSRLASYRDGLGKERAMIQQYRDELQVAQAAAAAARERVQMLEQQVLVYKDDFKSEREDRERAQSRIQELEEDLARLRLQLPRKQEHRDPAALHQGRVSPYYLETDIPAPLLGHGTDPLVEISRPLLPSGSPGVEARQQGLLQCPKCMRLFNDEVSDECLRHISECCQ
ncbi:TNFAIP3-interacting protein 2 [Carcharodon carcharias]|uniref:TNFAIP3-interacting protein 2 n=1 Tax=Carcharodon carcharias TaxID=13397 RepID=UPI001B7ED7A1|nr:TNFAIP3-interacting protein 2 [Carcharodon carcharias]